MNLNQPRFESIYPKNQKLVLKYKDIVDTYWIDDKRPNHNCLKNLSNKFECERC